MTQKTLTMIDTTGIQAYIFGSNRLRENIGASHLVEMATGAWVESMTTVNERVYQGGGNALFLFDTIERARNFVTELSRKLLIEAPGLEIAVAHREFDNEQEAIGGKKGVYNDLMDKLAHYKQQRPVSVPLLGLGVTLACRSTGLPSTEFDEDRPISADIAAKVRNSIQDEANERLLNMLFPNREPDKVNKHLIRIPLPDGTTEEYALSNRIDHLGRTKGESSYIAVVYADGNGMGKRFKELIESYSDVSQNQKCLDNIRSLSNAVRKAGETALRQTINLLLGTLKYPDSQWEEETRKFVEGMSFDTKTKKHFLPFRPLVYGGDDITFVCDGRLGLTLAATYLKEFEQATINLPGGQAFASAGVAIVKSHYPFARAYALAEQLCKSAKKEIKKRKIEDTSMIDWHIAASGVLDTLDGIRQREYRVQDGKQLQARPLTLHRGNGTQAWRSWESISHLIEVFTKNETWCDKRNKVKALREALRQGEQATKHFLTMYGLGQLPELDHKIQDLHQIGWDLDAGQCGYFDAIEAMDMYLPLTMDVKGEDGC